MMPARLMRGEIAPPSPQDPALGLLRILDEKGLADPAEVPALAPQAWLELYRTMVLGRLLDGRLMALQRQGRISFYAESQGHEAILGSAAALEPGDWVVPAFREAWIALARGLPLRTYLAQVMGNANDPALGHQMPCHPGLRAIRYVTMSSCVGNQLPQAAGLAWGAKLMREPAVTLGYLGDGATSEPDFHVAMNFAGVYQLPVVFICQNNQWAISTPCERQTASATLAVKALAYGMPGIRVDGNDVMAVHRATREAVARARSGGGPTLIETLTYRIGAHSSSDDPARYRDEATTAAWRRKDPIERLRRWLLLQGHLDEAGERALRDEVEQEIRQAIEAEERAPAPARHTLIEQVMAGDAPWLEEELAESAVEPSPSSTRQNTAQLEKGDG